MNIAGIICLCIGVLLISTFSILYTVHNSRKELTKMPFKEGIDLVGLPIVTFECNNKKLRFLLDTGSDKSMINQSIVEDLNAKQLPLKSTTVGAGGIDLETFHYELEIKYKTQSFKEEFGAINLDEVFNAIKQDNGVQLHGILGSKFFTKYKYIIDFNELIAHQ